MNGRRLGVFGGAFDPPHIGHTVVAQDVYEELDLDRLIVVPTARPPHREAVLPAEQRLELTRAAFAGDRRFEVSDIELQRPGPSWMVETLAEIRRSRRPDALVLVIGADQYLSFASWREPERIVSLAELAVMPREGAYPSREPAYPFTAVPVTRVDISSTQIRDRLSRGLGAKYLVPDVILGRLEQCWSELDSVVASMEPIPPTSKET